MDAFIKQDPEYHLVLSEAEANLLVSALRTGLDHITENGSDAVSAVAHEAIGCLESQLEQ